jgi:hypothetical protein
MTSARATFGDFLDAARRHLAAAADQRTSVTPGRDLEEVCAALLHVVTALNRYAADVTRVISRLPDEQMDTLSAWDRAGVQVYDALLSAAEAVGQGGHRSARTATSFAAQHLDAAATSLVAGRDLLAGHFAVRPGGAIFHQSGWAPVITSSTVSRALLVETASLARQSAIVGAAIPLPANAQRLEAYRRLGVACGWLGGLEGHVRAPSLSSSTEALAP